MKGVIAMSDFKNYLAQQMEDPAFAAEYEAQRPEYEAIRAVIAARLACNMTQKELAEKTGIRQSNISRIENGSRVVADYELDYLATALGTTIDHLLGKE